MLVCAGALQVRSAGCLRSLPPSARLRRRGLPGRLIVARELLGDSGSVLAQIGTGNLTRVALLLDDTLGGDSFVEMIAFRKKGRPLTGRLLEGGFDCLLWYAKDKDQAKSNRLFVHKTVEGDPHWNRVELPDGTRRKMAGVAFAPHLRRTYTKPDLTQTGFCI